MAPVVPGSRNGNGGGFGEVELGAIDSPGWDGGSIGILAPGQREGRR